MSKFNFSILGNKLPDIVWRNQWNLLSEKFGLPYSRGYMQNLDAVGQGPDQLPIKGRVAYSKESVISWLNDRFIANDYQKIETN